MAMVDDLRIIQTFIDMEVENRSASGLYDYIGDARQAQQAIARVCGKLVPAKQESPTITTHEGKAAVNADEGVEILSEFTFTHDCNGYMIYYRWRPIGGAGVKLPRGRPLRGKQRQQNAKDFADSARMEIRDLEAGRGQKRFRDVMADIDKELTASD